MCSSDLHLFQHLRRDDPAVQKGFSALRQINQDLLWLHVLTSTVMYAKYVVEGTLPDTQETEDTIFQLLTTGLSGYLQPGASKKRG